MMDSSEVIVLDVGHGNCSIIRSEGASCVIDAPYGSTLLETLGDLGISKIDAIIVSHADKDHVAGVSALLTSRDICVGTLYVNPDSTKKGERSPWMKLRISIAEARKKGEVKVRTGIDSGLDDLIKVGGIDLEVLAPSPELALGGPGSVSLDGKSKLTSNSTSVVVRVLYGGNGLVLFPGDLDGVGLDSMIADGKVATAKALLFPHHGGLPGNESPAEFAARMCEFVKPNIVIFSNSREHYSNPRPEIVDALKAKSDARIVCTQLSKECRNDIEGINNSHLLKLPARGRVTNSCCAGTVQLALKDLLANDITCLAKHQVFVSEMVGTPLCKRGAS